MTQHTSAPPYNQLLASPTRPTHASNNLNNVTIGPGTQHHCNVTGTLHKATDIQSK